MTFDKILENNSLWAVRYAGEEHNSLRMVFNQWNDPRKMEQVRNLLIEQGAIDADGFEDYLTETK